MCVLLVRHCLCSGVDIEVPGLPRSFPTLTVKTITPVPRQPPVRKSIELRAVAEPSAAPAACMSIHTHTHRTALQFAWVFFTFHTLTIAVATLASFDTIVHGLSNER